MIKIESTSQFRRDIKRQAKKGSDIVKLEAVVETLASEHPLASKYRNHKLVGNFVDHWECHIEPDWLLIYRFTREHLLLVRTGSHSDLF
jgi:mRNA interferase YafQ